MTLRVFQSLWAMEDLPRGGPVWTPTQWVEQIAGAGFDGLAVDLGAGQRPAAAALVPALSGSGLDTAVFAFLRTDADLDEALTYAAAIDAALVVACAQVFGPDLRVLAGTVERWHARAAAAGVELQLETHRGTMTNDLRTTVALLAELDDQIGVAVDLSHHVCGCELPDEPSDEIEQLIGAVIARASSLQGRVATRGQIQVPLDHVGAQQWVRRFRQWWCQGMAAVLSRRPDVMFCAELGTTPYAATDVDGRELSDRWADALLLKQWAHELYVEANATVTDPTVTDPAGSSA